MSVDYKSALIYGFECDPTEWSHKETEAMAEIGWDVIRDYYADSFLYIGKTVSETDCYEDARVDCLANLQTSMREVKGLISKTPDKYFDKLPPFSCSMYHLCYAT